MSEKRFDRLQQIFDRANVYFFNKDYDNYVDEIIALHSQMQCNCFCKKQREIFEEQADFLDSIDFNTHDWAENFAKGFIYLKNKNEIWANYFFTTALKIKEHPLLFSLRSTISSKENPDNIDDSSKAIQLDPSARNYFIRANLITSLNTQESASMNLKYLNRAIELEPDFACAYNNRANHYANSGNLSAAIADYKSCIQQQPEHWAYKPLLKYLLQENKIGEALFYTDLAIEHVDDKDFFILEKAEILVNFEQYDEALKHLRSYHKKFPANFKLEHKIEEIEEKKIKIYLKKGHELYDNGDFLQASNYFQFYESIGGSLYLEDIDKFLISLIKINNPRFILEEEKKRLELKNGIPKSYGNWEKLTFGKYKGKAINEIKATDPNYILWCALNLDHFTIPKHWFLQAEFRNGNLFYPALEKNIVKLEYMASEIDNDTYEDIYYEEKNYTEPNSMSSEYYNDSLDMDQQSPEFWDSI